MWVAERNTSQLFLFSPVLIFNPVTISLDQEPNFCQCFESSAFLCPSGNPAKAGHGHEPMTTQRAPLLAREEASFGGKGLGLAIEF